MGLKLLVTECVLKMFISDILASSSMRTRPIFLSVLKRQKVTFCAQMLI